MAEIFERLKIGAPNGERHRAIRGGKDSLRELDSLNRPKMRKDEKVPSSNKTDQVIQNLFANAFHVTNTNESSLFQYVFAIEPEQPSKNVRRALVNRAMKEQLFGGCLSFDGMNGWSNVCIASGDTEIVTQTREGTRVTIKCVLTGEMPRESPTARQMLNVLLREAQTALGQVQIRRNYFQPTMSKALQQERLEVWPGFNTRIDDFDGGRLLMLDVAHTVLRMETVLDKMNEWREHHRAGAIEMIRRELIGASVLCRHNNLHYVVHDVDFDLSPSSTIPGRDCTYAEYFKDKHGITIQNLEQPLLMNTKKGQERKRAEEAGQPVVIHLIPEVCWMTGITEDMRKNFNLMRSLGEYTRPVPSKRVEAYLKFNDSMCETAAAQRLQPWGLTFAKELVKIDTPRLLSAETIEFGDNQKCDLRTNGTNPAGRADWGRQMGGKKLKECHKIENCVVICPEQLLRQTSSFLNLIEKQMGIMGFPARLSDIINIPGKDGDYVRAIRQVMNNNAIKCDIVVVILRYKTGPTYNVVKTMLTCEAGIPSQCIVFNPKNMGDPRRASSVAQKIAIQMYTKTGSIPWSVNIPSKTMMVIGIDVFHQKNKPSVLGFVASMNPDLTSYWSNTSIHLTPGEEIASTLEINFTRALKEYYSKNGKIPDQVFFFRDGVGEGQLQVVRDQEVNVVLRAATGIREENPPKIIYTIVTKRVPQRFLLRKGPELYGNPDPGTIVDKTVTQSEFLDYFLISQSTNQGTISPTHYNVIFTQSRFSLAIQQSLTYKLTHTYFNWQGTVKVPAPCQYAHKLAYHVGENLTAGGVSGQPHPSLAHKMHFL